MLICVSSVARHTTSCVSYLMVTLLGVSLMSAEHCIRENLTKFDTH
jgi:hypothetical protein